MEIETHGTTDPAAHLDVQAAPLFSSETEPSVQVAAPSPDNEVAVGTDDDHVDRSSRKEESTKAERQEFFLPVSGFVWLYPEEVRVVNHPAFQRLGRIYQLGQTYLVYRGATHKRIEHALGCLSVIQRMIDALGHTSEKASLAGRAAGAPLSSVEERFVRLGALLHDIGHLAAGHTVEDELYLIGKHDEDRRLDLVFEKPEFTDKDGQTLGQVIDSHYGIYLPLSLRELRPVDIVRLLIRKLPTDSTQATDSTQDRFAEKHAILGKSDDIRMNVCRDMIGNTICADLLDYLHRDWYHVGKPKPFEERILQYMEIRATTDLQGTKPVSKSTDQLVISIGEPPRYRTDAISAILELLEWRYQLAESVLFHRTKLAAAAMLDRALWELWHHGNDDEIERTLLPLSDDQMLEHCQGLGAQQNTPEGEVAASLLRDLANRNLQAHLYTGLYQDFGAETRKRIEATFGGQPEARNRSLRQLEKDFDLPPGSLSMYCPKEKMNAKIAEVKIAVGKTVQPFNEYERDNENALSGGHLDAQLKRFKRLWRVHFFIDRAIKEEYSSIVPILADAIHRLVLGSDQGNPVHAARGIALQLATESRSRWYGKKVEQVAVTGAYRDPSAVKGAYLLGAPSIASFFK